MRPKTLEERSEMAGGRTAAQTDPPGQGQGPRIVGYHRAEDKEDPTALAGPQDPTDPTCCPRPGNPLSCPKASSVGEPPPRHADLHPGLPAAHPLPGSGRPALCVSGVVSSPRHSGVSCRVSDDDLSGRGTFV